MSNMGDMNIVTNHKDCCFGTEAWQVIPQSTQAQWGIWTTAHLSLA